MQTGGGVRALIIGAGLGGLATAVALRRVGIEPVVFERARDLRQIQVGGAYSMWYTGMRALRRLDLAEQVQAAGGPIERFEFHTWRGQTLANWDVGKRGRELDAPPTGVMRADLHRVLAGALEEGTIRFGAAYASFEQDAAGVTARFADGREERGGLLIGADGFRSTIRAQLHGAFKPRYPGYGHWYGFLDLERELTPMGVFRIHYGHGARFAFLPISRERLCWWSTFPAPPAESAPESNIKEMLLDRFRGWQHPVESVIAATDAGAIARRDTLGGPPLARWGEGRVTLLGDAAHPMTFNLGQGAGSALKDGVMLAQYLRAEGDVVAALRAYEERRIPNTTRFIHQSWQVGRMDAWEPPLGSTVHDWILRLGRRAVIGRLESDLDFEMPPTAGAPARVAVANRG